MPNVEFLVIHHTAGSKDDTMEQERTLHLNEGYKDIAYNGFIEYTGIFKIGRDPNTTNEDQNAANHGLNSKSLSIALAGNFELIEPSKEQINILIQVLASWCKKYKVSASRIIGHYQVKDFSRDKTDATACPGKNLIKILPEIRQKVQVYL